MPIKLDRVTITGADSRTPIQELMRLSEIYPFVEWGILVSEKRECSERFPSPDWMRAFTMAASSANMQVSVHVCGQWVRDLLANRLSVRELPVVLHAARRVQINTHAEETVSVTAAFNAMAYRSDKHQFIFQLDGVNDHLLPAASTYGVDCAGLFDASHGAGVLPRHWPTPRRGLNLYHGYAGGLGPDNVVVQIKKIQAGRPADNATFWIDMEGQVRTDDKLDLDKVERVLSACKPFIEE